MPNMPSVERAKAAIFDLDGTLVDTWPDTRAALLLHLADIGVGEASIAEIGEEAAGLTAGELLNACGLTADESAVYSFRRHIASVTGRHLRVTDGTPDLLAELNSAGWLLTVATNKPDDLATRVLEVSGLAHWFNAVYGGTSCALKPHTEQISRSLGTIPTTRAVMVGDSRTDALAAVTADLAGCFWVGGPPDHDLGSRVRVVGNISDLSVAWLEECLDVRRLHTNG